jgi:RimJ/RimL family protein N-acetyltransferase
MIKGIRIVLRPVQEQDWSIIETWGKERDGLWEPYQRHQLDHLPLLRKAFQQTDLLKRESGILLIETLDTRQVIGFVRYTLISVPDSDTPHPEIGFGLPEAGARGKGYAKEALNLLVDYLFSGYPTERITAFTDSENIPAQRTMESIGFQREGTLRRSMFRDGRWCDVAIYALLREEWKPA